MSGDTLLLTVELGEATFKDDGDIERTVVMQSMPDQAMTILNEETNNRFLISWGDVLGLAIEAGLLTKESNDD